MRSGKKMMLIMCAGLASFALAACGGPGSEAEDGSEPVSEQISEQETADDPGTKQDQQTADSAEPEDGQDQQAADSAEPEDGQDQQMPDSSEPETGQEQESEKPVVSEQMAKIAGTYEISDVITEEGDTHSGDLQILAERGAGCTLTLKEDGTGVLVLFGAKTLLDWDEEIISDGETAYPYSFADGQLTLLNRGSTLVFVPADPEE